MRLDEADKLRWIGRDAVPALLADVFGVEDRTQLKQGKTSLPLLDNEYSERVRAGKSNTPVAMLAKY
jgi:protein transport protein SEC24